MGPARWESVKLQFRPLYVVLVAALLVVSLSAGARAANPRVAATVPAAGDGAVDPGLGEIRVTFDQAMDPASVSFVTLGSGFPQVTGQPYWVDDTTIALPVRLEPDTGYWLLVNSPSFQGFRNRSGEPAVPRLLAFWTAGGEHSEEPGDAERERNQRAYEQVVELMTIFYSYKDRLGIDWAERLAGAREWLLSSRNDLMFGVRLVEVLAPAMDAHLAVGVAGPDGNVVTLPTRWAMAPANYNLQAVLAKLTNVKQWSSAVVSGEAGDIGYVLIGGWVPDADVAIEAVAAMSHKAAIIVDVRPNSGGDERIAQRVAGCFTDEAVDYALSLTLDPETLEFTRLETRTFQPNPACGPYAGEVVVLTGPQVMSSNEAFLLMMRAAGATLIGAPSFGSSGNPQPCQLANGLVLYVPQWQALDLDGRLVEGNGVTPDIVLDVAPDRFASADPVFDAAVALVSRQERD